MSYSFGVRAATKVEALDALAKKFKEITVDQPAHDLDEAMVQTAASHAVDLLTLPTDNDGPAAKDVCINVHGSISHYADNRVTAVSLSLTAELSLRTGAHA